MQRGHLIVISGPSGAGKGTLIKRILDMRDDCWLSVSATTRAPRKGEQDGKNYFFMDRKDFEESARDGGFLEWAEYSGNLYGTPIESVREKLDSGKNVILEIEVQGAALVKDRMPDAVMVFIMPPSMEVLRERLCGRGTEDAAAREMRMEAAAVEMKRAKEYDKQIVNDDLGIATQELSSYLDEITADVSVS